MQFARQAGLKRRRVQGEVARLGFLNEDSYAILEVDPVAGQVRLHRDRLVSQYQLRDLRGPA